MSAPERGTPRELNLGKPQLCSHGLSDNVDVLSSTAVRGAGEVSRHYLYYCRDHEHYGNYKVTTADPQTL